MQSKDLVFATTMSIKSRKWLGHVLVDSNDEVIHTTSECSTQSVAERTACKWWIREIEAGRILKDKK